MSQGTQRDRACLGGSSRAARGGGQGGCAGAQPWGHICLGIVQSRRKKMERCLLKPACPFPPPPRHPKSCLSWGQPGKGARPARDLARVGLRVRRKPFRVSRLRPLGPFGAHFPSPLPALCNPHPSLGRSSCPAGPHTLAAKQTLYFKLCSVPNTGTSHLRHV